MTDHVGLLQHATLDNPNPAFGYCTDDNARALMFAVQALEQSSSDRRLEPLVDHYFQFIQDAFLPESGMFRNLMDYDGKWADEAGPGDSQGRALWALGVLVSRQESGARHIEALQMFKQALPASEAWQDIRPVANAILGACAILESEPSTAADRTLRLLVYRLTSELAEWQEPNWPWFESTMTYENARIPHALIAGGEKLEDASITSQGLASLEWLMAVQTLNGHFSPIGNDGWYRRGNLPAPFDQQPIEAEASISACAAAYRVTGDAKWLRHVQTAFDWFRGANAVGQPLGNLESGGCCDGLGPGGANQNQGAESTLAWLFSQLHMETLAPRMHKQTSKEVAR